jgi:hypothetical protein
MLKIINIALILFLYSTANVANTTVTDSTNADSVFIVVPPSPFAIEKEIPLQLRKKPLVAGGLSLLLPGAGQWYDGNKVRAGIFLAGVGVSAAITINRGTTAKIFEKNTNDWKYARDIYKARSDTASDSAIYAMWRPEYERAYFDAEKAEYEAIVRHYSFRQSLYWTAGFYVWNVMDAIQRTNALGDNNPRSPVRAALLSAIPGLAIGQLYNGSISKAGFIWMTQGMLALCAYDYHLAMVSAQNNTLALADKNSWQYAHNTTYGSDWQGNVDEMFRRRNMYLWYSVFFYMYSVFDAVVDAHLHDYNQRIRFSPTVSLLNSNDTRIGMVASW